MRKKLKEIATTLIEIAGALAIAIGVGINWGFGTALIVGGVFALILSYLPSLEVTE